MLPPLVCSRIAVEEGMFPMDLPYVIISITDSADTPVEVLPMSVHADILRLSFDGAPDETASLLTEEDIAGFTGSTDSAWIKQYLGNFQFQYVKFDEEMAQRVLDFVLRYRDTHRFIIHCNCGISRSSAVAAAVAELQGFSSTYYFSEHSPRLGIYKMLMRMSTEQQLVAQTRPMASVEMIEMRTWYFLRDVWAYAKTVPAAVNNLTKFVLDNTVPAGFVPSGVSHV